MTDCFIYDAVRTPRGKGRKKDGALADAPPLQMAKAVLQALPERGGFDSSAIEDVIFGCVEPVGEQGANVGRMAAMISGYDDSVPGVQLNRFCSSGLEAVNIAAAKVKAGDLELVVGGGMESMSRISMGAAGGAWSTDPELAWGTSFVPQGIGADLIATKHGYSRNDVDAFAVESQARAASAWEGNYFAGSIIPVEDAVGVTMLDRDEHMRPGTTLDDLSQLKPSFEMMGAELRLRRGRHPEASGGRTDRARTSRRELVRYRRRRRRSAARHQRSWGAPRIASACSHRSLGHRGKRALHHAHRPGARVAKGARSSAGMKASDIDLWEINEAFSSVCLLFMEEMGIDRSGHQRQRRRHRLRASARRDRRDAPRHHGRRARATRLEHRADHALRRRRHGNLNHHRASLETWRLSTIEWKTALRS